MLEFRHIMPDSAMMVNVFGVMKGFRRYCTKKYS